MSTDRPDRQSFPRFALFALGLAAGLAALAAQPPEREVPKAKPPAKKVLVEDEDPKGAVKKKVVVDDPPEPKGTAGVDPTQKLEELARAADAASHPALKELLARFSVPFDRLTETTGAVSRIRPIPLFRTDRFPKEFGVADLDEKNQPKPVRPVAVAQMKRVDYFEELALAEANQLLKQKPLGTAPGPDGLVAEDQLAAAEGLLAAALRFHTAARTPPAGRDPVRQGRGWDAVRQPLADRLREVRLWQLQRAVTVADWTAARALGTRLMTEYPDDPGVGKEVAAARVAEAGVLMKSKDHADHARARYLLDEFEAKYPGAGGDPVRKLRKELSAEAARLFDRAKALKDSGNLVDARNELARAEALDPEIPGLREMKRELRSGYAVLYVGVRQFPERMSPAAARFDSERQAVELLFEGFLEPVPDPAGGRYRPGAAQAFPTVAPGGRDLLLRQAAPGGGLPGFDAHDAVDTVKLLRAKPELWAASAVPWLDDLPAPTGPAALRVRFRHGHPDPRSLLTFKLLPGRWLAERNKGADDPEFAAKPFGTGPFRLYAVPPPTAAGPREVVFVDNPAYGRWKDRVGLPHVREVRLTDVTRLPDPLEEFRAGRLHLLPDLTPAELARALSQGNDVGGKGRVVTAATNRRVHVLAVNHRRPPFRNRDLRKGLSAAIDREAILTEVFRTTPPEYRRLTAPMTGPYPPASWAAKLGSAQPVPLLNPGDALARFRRYLATPVVKADFTLSYPAGDPQAAAVCDRIKAQVEGLFKDTPDGKKLTLVLEPLPPGELHKRVVEEHRYDLAYVPFDYPDDWYPFGLAALLDPSAAGRGGRNYLGYLLPETAPDADDRELGGWLMGLREHRDYAGQIAPRAARVHQLFNDCVPFVPLWQVDRHTLVHSGLRVFVDDSAVGSPPELLDPTVLFHNAARWRLE